MMVASILFAFLLVAHCSGEEENIFESPPQKMTVRIGAAVLMSCKTYLPVEECQWSWQAPDIGNNTIVIVKTFPSFGDFKQDCSVRFSSILQEQDGIWTCRVKKIGGNEFYSAASSRLTVLPPSTVKFIKEPTNIEVEKGSPIKFSCETLEKNGECRWSWRPLDNKNHTDILVQMFSPFGDKNSDCSIRIASVSLEQQGYWTCLVRDDKTQELIVASPAKLTVLKREIEFSELSTDSIVSLGTSVQLVCKTSINVEVCQWRWKSPIGSEQKAVLIRNFAPQGNNSNDCSIYYESIQAEQEGFWICGARLAGEENFTYAKPITLNIYTGLEFVQLSREIQKSIGEPVLLQCVTNIPVAECKWSFRWDTSNETEMVISTFPPSGEEKRDCSIRIRAILEEQKGFWYCAVRTQSSTVFSTASATNIVLLPAVKTRFFDQPQDKRVGIGDVLLLPCKATTKVEECQWSWYPLNSLNETERVIKTFPPFGQYGRDCSIRFQKIYADQQGWWKCTIRGYPNSTVMSTPEAKVEVYEPEPVEFLEIPQDIQVPKGDPTYLPCITATPVEECLWSLQRITESNTTSVVTKNFTSFGKNQENCSLSISMLTHEDEGMWTCSVRHVNETHYSSTSPATVNIIKSESVMVSLISTTDQKITLVCQLSSSYPKTVCHWQHPTYKNIEQAERFLIAYNLSTSTCKITFTPSDNDFGQWRCSFTLNTSLSSSSAFEIASTSLVLLATPSDEKVNWLIGILAGLVLVLTLLLTGIGMCKCHPLSTTENSDLKSTVAKNNETKNNCERYTGSPSKIDFQFEESQNPSTSHAQPQQPIYERVEKYTRPSTCKSIYENVK